MEESGPEALAELRRRIPEVDKIFGEQVVWDEAEDRKRVHIAAIREGDADVERQEEWPVYQDWLVETAIRLRDALQPEIERL